MFTLVILYITFNRLLERQETTYCLYSLVVFSIFSSATMKSNRWIIVKSDGSTYGVDVPSVCILVVEKYDASERMGFVGGGGRGAGGVLWYFHTYVGSGPGSTVHPKKILGISSTPPPPPPKKKKYPRFCTLTLRKDPKMHRNDRKI